MWVGIIQSVKVPDRTKRQRKVEFSFLSWDIHLLLPTDDRWQGLPVLGPLYSRTYTSCAALLLPQAFSPKLELYQQLPWFSGPHSYWIIPPSFLVLQLADSYCGISQPPALCEPIPILNLLFYLSLYILLVLFLWRTLILNNFMINL